MQIEKLINKIKSNVTVGHDDLSAKLIITPVIIEDFANFVNLSYETKIFPDQLKIAIVKPIQKKRQQYTIPIQSDINTTKNKLDFRTKFC